MRLPQLQRPAVAAVIAGGYRPVLSTFTLPIRPAIQTIPVQSADGCQNGVVDGRRYASVKAQGAYRIPNKKTIAKKLGAKRSGDQFVIPGNIIFKQRGTIWHPGENALRGRDHTIHAAATGYVKYYRDPELHPTRQYIGVAFNRDDVLPYPKNEPRRRKLGMVATVRKPGAAPRSNISASGLPQRVVRKGGLWDVEKLEARLWSRDKKRELAEAQAAATKANLAMKHRKEKRNARKEAKKAGLTTAAPKGTSSEPAAAAATSTPEGSSAQAAAAPKSSPAEAAAAKAAAAGGETEATPVTSTTAAATAEDAKPKARSRKRKLVTPMAFMQKQWLERRRTKVLHLNPQSYAYAESNAAIGRLVSRTMYTAPWKLGGRKARFRSRRQKREQRITQIKENRAFVAREKERERIAEEKARQRKLEKQRAKGAAKAAAAEKAEKAEKAEEGAEVKNAEGETKAVEGESKAAEGDTKAAEKVAEVKNAEVKNAEGESKAVKDETKVGEGETKAGEKVAEVVKPAETKPTET